MGHFFLSPSGRRKVVINSEPNSVTTNKHVRVARDAVVGHNVDSFRAPIDDTLARMLTAGDYEGAWGRIVSHRDAMVMLNGMRGPGMDSKTSDAIISAVEFASTWATHLERLEGYPAEGTDVAKRWEEAKAYRRKMEERRKKAEATRNDMSPEAIARRQQDYAKRNAALLTKHNRWVTWKLLSLRHWRDFEQAPPAVMSYSDQRKMEEMHEKLGHGPFPTALRRKTDGDVETSRGAVVPWRDAVRLYHGAAYVRREGKADGGAKFKGQRCGHFTLSRIEPNGDVQVGCHFLTFNEMHLLAVKHGVALDVTEPQTEMMEV